MKTLFQDAKQAFEDLGDCVSLCDAVTDRQRLDIAIFQMKDNILRLKLEPLLSLYMSGRMSAYEFVETLAEYTEG